MGTSAKKSVLGDVQSVQKAARLIELGARLQLVQSECPDLSRDRCIALYKEVTGESPPKGPLPFSTDWFLNRAPNAHASLFMGMLNRIELENPTLERTETLLTSFELYLSVIKSIENPPLLTINRAWTLYRHVSSGVLRLMSCCKCTGKFVVDPYDITHSFTCNLCDVASRPGPRMSLDSKHYQRYFIDLEND